MCVLPCQMFFGGVYSVHRVFKAPAKTCECWRAKWLVSFWKNADTENRSVFRLTGKKPRKCTYWTMTHKYIPKYTLIFKIHRTPLWSNRIFTSALKQTLCSILWEMFYLHSAAVFPLQCCLCSLFPSVLFYSQLEAHHKDLYCFCL